MPIYIANRTVICEHLNFWNRTIKRERGGILYKAHAFSRSSMPAPNKCRRPAGHPFEVLCGELDPFLVTGILRPSEEEEKGTPKRRKKRRKRCGFFNFTPAHRYHRPLSVLPRSHYFSRIPTRGSAPAVRLTLATAVACGKSMFLDISSSCCRYSSDIQ